MTARPEPTRCHSCEAPILFGRAESGSLIPFDAEPSSAGTWALTWNPTTGVLRAEHAAGRLHEFRGRNLFVTHFATCPNADLHRRRQAV